MNTKMKVLSLAMVGLAGFAGSAMAACPAGPTTAQGGAWSSDAVNSATLAITTPGLNGTACALSVTVNSGASTLGKAFVTDNSPQNEQRYRARFYIDTTNMAKMTSALFQSQVFAALASTSPTGTSLNEVNITLVGGAGGPHLRFVVADSSAAGSVQVVDAPLGNILGKNRVEFDLVQGASAAFRYWVSTDVATTADNAPTGTLTIGSNTGWSGAKQASLGILNASGQYRAGAASTLVVDEFDSRRQTFIGQ